ncbi:PREDICTED: cysteine proteinase inhibitor A-like [Ipomoea nil]|uniref:cysteine proteinase inhibitor A-like n=1 Tax=Ipomoea nil TaxID=35883 RepID=UPI00090146BE|nr:PREDICTED: cysteine proteinase inhibitor A-like [Ipomoea nil]
MALGAPTEGKCWENNLEIEELARFAVTEHNKKANTELVFEKVLNVKTQVVAGTIYDITLAASYGGEKKVYEAKIWVKPWENFKELQEFKLAADVSAEATVKDSKPAGGISSVSL